MRRRERVWVIACLPAVLIALAIAAGTADAQQGRGGGARGAGAAPPTARSTAPHDFTGYYVAVVTEHWHLRMEMPPKGDVSMLPVNPAARVAANMWTPAQDAGGNECRAYGAASIMRIPGRIHIHWADDNTLQIDTDSGTQTRMLHFGGAAPADFAPTWQGYSVAQWAGTQVGRGGRTPGPKGDLGVVTTKMKAGYLRKNGVPYSDNTSLQEYFDTFTEPEGTTWLVVTSIITDPMYLTGPYATTNQFKKIPDMQGWDPTPCRPDQPR